MSDVLSLETRTFVVYVQIELLGINGPSFNLLEGIIWKTNPVITLISYLTVAAISKLI